MTDTIEKKRLLNVVNDYKPRQTTVLMTALVLIVMIGATGAAVIDNAETAKEVITMCKIVAGGVIGYAARGARDKIKS